MERVAQPSNGDVEVSDHKTSIRFLTHTRYFGEEKTAKIMSNNQAGL
jgi:hypothetical protein